MKTFQLKIISSNQVFYDGEAVSLVVPQHEGLMGILANHENMALSIVDGTIHYTLPDGTTQYVATGVGMVSIVNNEVTVLVAYALRPEEIDLRRAEEAAERAMEKIRQKKSIEEYRLSQASLARAMARLSAARRKY